MSENLLKERNIEVSAEQILGQYCVSKEFVSNILTAGVILLPSIQREDIYGFPVGIEDFYNYCKSNNINIDICAEGNPCIIELCSLEIRLGHIFVSVVVLPLLLNVLSNFIFQKLSEIPSKQPQTIVRDYQAEPIVSFTISIEDSCGVVKKEYSYEGPAKDINEVTKHIEKLWNEDTTK